MVAAVALGSNLGDRISHLAFARERLTVLLANVRFSSILETAPVGSDVPQQDYLNQAAVGETTLTARELLAALHDIERERGRDRPFVNAPRTLDLDLILFGDRVIDEEGLHIPHPRFRGRRFVLEPLAQIAPELRDPISGTTVRELLARTLAGESA
ncbi:MAG TPA: 2-amino-4-hydroxy-6-hydroxymethyldihydropteridine diphosphokinase [Vicinamibacterales bacterium]|nr:2-amino-4-hydroxy-6-hydroxymethyldihydropteridine diphosphokinase [Vicinamibacterales bacterium]